MLPNQLGGPERCIGFLLKVLNAVYLEEEQEIESLNSLCVYLKVPDNEVETVSCLCLSFNHKRGIRQAEWTSTVSVLNSKSRCLMDRLMFYISVCKLRVYALLEPISVSSCLVLLTYWTVLSIMVKLRQSTNVITCFLVCLLASTSVIASYVELLGAAMGVAGSGVGSIFRTLGREERAGAVRRTGLTGVELGEPPARLSPIPATFKWHPASLESFENLLELDPNSQASAKEKPSGSRKEPVQKSMQKSMDRFLRVSDGPVLPDKTEIKWLQDFAKRLNRMNISDREAALKAAVTTHSDVLSGRETNELITRLRNICAYDYCWVRGTYILMIQII